MQPLLALKASAGSGKTFQLTLRYLSLLFHGANPGEILALTFTKKAASEMKDRIRTALEVLVAEDESRHCALLMEELHKSGLPTSRIKSEKNRIYARFLDSDLKIMTIDAFLGQILRKFCWYAGVRHTFEIKNDQSGKIERQYLHALTDREMESLIAFASIEEKKLKSIFSLFALLLEKEKELPEHCPPAESDNPEAQIMQHALSIKSYFMDHESASDSARKAVQFETVSELIDKGKTWLTKESLKDYTYFKKAYTPILDENLQRIKELLPHWYVFREKKQLASLFHLFDLYRKIRFGMKQRNNELSFDDVSKKTFDLMRGEVDSAFLYFRLDARLDHILIDEFQDTSILQYAILKPLIDEIRSGFGQHEELRSFFYVGDTKQSIYRFRGSSGTLFDHVGNGMDIRELNVNYRSQGDLVRFVNERFASKIPGYFDQSSRNPGGYVDVSLHEEVITPTVEKAAWLLDQGVHEEDIAILTFKNDDILLLQDSLNEALPHVRTITETSSKLIEQPRVKALISLMKHLHFREDIYRAEFLTLLGMPPFSPLDTGFLSKSLLPAARIKAVMDQFGLYDDNTTKFLEHTLRYPDMESFIDEIDYLDTAIEASTQKGIRLMTIHKSKGLEFPHILLPDRIGGKKRGSHPLIFEYEGIDLKKIWTRMKSRESFESDYAQALSKEAALQLEDRLNMLYVAMTRPKESLHVFMKKKESEFDIIDLSPRQMGTFPKQAQKQEPKKPTLPPYSATLRDYGRQHDFVHTEKEYTPDNHAAIKRGLATHLFFEHSDFYGNLFSMDIRSFVQNRYGIYLESGALDEIEKLHQRALELPAFKKAISNARLYRELSYIKEGKPGQIDLLAVKDKELIIIDYKTSEQVYPGYIEQVNAYRDVAEEFLQFPSRGFVLLLKEKPAMVEIKR